MKKFLQIFAFTLLFLYLLSSLVYAQKRVNEKVCNEFIIELRDSSRMHLLSTAEARRIIKNKNLYPVGKSFDLINLDAIERCLQEMKQVKSVACYRLPGGNIKVEIEQRTPLLRVISSSGNYFVDLEGKDMPVSRVQSVYIPVATGNIQKEFATKDLYEFALFLQRDRFWDAQIEQIVVQDTNNIILVPRVGSHTILIGDVTNLDSKFKKLKKLYDDGFSEIGWNKYRSVDLRFKNQVICSK
ncbi:MAG: cell division protein FtsQ/DivIB [Bacteroidales bacterium]